MSKSKITLEFDMKSTPFALLWNYISSAAGLSKWFADDVEIDGKEYTFFWNKAPQKAMLTAMRVESHIRLHWVDDDYSRSYFEMRIGYSDLTDSVSLLVTDFAEPGDEEELAELWRSQIDTLRRNIGC